MRMEKAMKMKLRLTALLLLLVTLLTSCDKPDVDPPKDDDKQIKSDGEMVTFFVESVANNFDIIYPAGDVTVAGDIAGKVYSTVVSAGISEPRTYADNGKEESVAELIVGETSRAISSEAMAMLDAKITAEPDAEHWIWLYKNGQIAFVANSYEAYLDGLVDLTAKYFVNGEFRMDLDTKDIGYVPAPIPPHEAYMSYEIPDNFYEGYEDPFNMDSKDYEEMIVHWVDAKTYRITYFDDRGGIFTADLVQKVWGVWNMGATTYTEKGGKEHNMTSSSTDYEFVLRVNGKGNSGLKSGNHGNYPKDSGWAVVIDPETGKEDPTSYYNDYLVDITFYDAKSGDKIEFVRIGQKFTVDGLRIVMHHNIYEFGYKQENVLINAERSYLYNGYDIMLDTKLYMTQDVTFTGSYSCMLPISKQYGNCAMFYCEDGSTVYMKTPMSNTQDETRMGVNSTFMDIWGENNPEYHYYVRLNNPEDQLASPTTTPGKGYCGFREMLGSGSNKLYCSLYTSSDKLKWGEELHFNTTWTFAIVDDFVAPDREPDYIVGEKK